jgi:hypothetical protein
MVMTDSAISRFDIPSLPNLNQMSNKFSRQVVMVNFLLWLIRQLRTLLAYGAVQECVHAVLNRPL